MKTTNPGKAVTEEPLTVPQVEAMLRAVLRVHAVYAMATSHLKVELFDAVTEPHCRLLWQTVQLYVTKFGADSLFSLPPRTVYSAMEVEADALVKQAPDLLPEPMRDMFFGTDRKTPGLLFWIYEVSTVDDCHVSQCREYLGRFLSERKVQRPLVQVLESAAGKPFVDLPAILQEAIAEEVSVRNVNVNPVKSISPPNYELPKIQQWSSGIPYVDKFTNDGHAACEVYGLLGAYGSGKTIFGVQMVVQSVLAELDKMDQAAAQGKVYKPRHSYLFHYEANEHEIRQRLWSHACEISWDVMQKFDRATLSSRTKPGSYKTYELDRWKHQLAATGMIDGELDRLSRLARLEPYIHIVDMSCPPDNPKLGTGYVPEISNILATWAVDHLDRIGVVVVDYVGVMCKRHVLAKGLPDERLRRLIGGFADAARIHIASQFKCPVWAFHQLAAAANKRSSAVKQHHSDAAEAKDWAENLTYAFQFGVPEDKSNCLRMTCTKARRSAKLPPVSLRIDGIFSQMTDANDMFQWDDQLGRFIPIAEAKEWATPALNEIKPKKGKVQQVNPYTGEELGDVQDMTDN